MAHGANPDVARQLAIRGPGRAGAQGGVTDSAEGLVTGALQDNGIDPAYNFSPQVQNTLRRGGEVAALVVMQSPEVLTDDAVLRTALSGFVGRALRGDRVFGGWSRSQYVALMDRVRAADATSDPGAQTLGGLLAMSDDVAVALAYAGLAGGLSESTASLVRQEARSGCVRYRSTVQVERPSCSRTVWTISPARACPPGCAKSDPQD